MKNSKNTIKKDIVIINQDSGYLMIDIANAYIAKGFQVSLVTGRLVLRNKTLDSRIKVHKIIRYNRDSTIKRLATWSIGFLQILFFVWIHCKGKKLLLVSNPPLATLIPLVTQNVFSLLIYDIYPDALIEYNILKETSFFIQQWKKANTKIFLKAEQVYTLNIGMKKILANYGSKNKVKVIPIWTDNSFLKPIPKSENPFIKGLELEKKFIIQYSGNLGKTHSVEKLLDVAKLLPEDPFFFLIIGGGEKFKLIEKEIQFRKIKNMKLLPWQAVDQIPFTLAAADIGVVTLGKEASNLSIPSKTYNLMSVGVPILGISCNNSALAGLIMENKIGVNLEEHEIENMKEFIQSLQMNESLKIEYQEKSLSLSKKFGPENAFEFI